MWHVNVSEEAESTRLVEAIASFAIHQIYGPTEDSVDIAEGTIGRAPTPTPVGIVPEEIDAGCHLYDYFRVLSALTSASTPPGRVREIDWPVVAQLWTGPVTVEVLFPERTPGGVSVEDDCVIVDLSFGALMRRLRRRAGDFRMGAMAIINAEQVPVDVGAFDPAAPKRTEIRISESSPMWSEHVQSGGSESTL
jgi:hypothetical protein